MLLFGTRGKKKERNRFQAQFLILMDFFTQFDPAEFRHIDIRKDDEGLDLGLGNVF